MKRCTKCGTEKPEEAFAMQPSRGHRRAECRECKAKADKEWIAKRKLNPPKPKIETKRCNTCHEVKPISEFTPRAPGYVSGRCKACTNARRQQTRREQYQNDPTGRFYWPFLNDEGVMVKRCTYCHAEKPLSEFYANGKHGRHGRCKVCDKAIKQANYEANPEKYCEAVRESLRRHPDRARARHQRWHLVNYDYCLQRYREYNEMHREERRAYDRIRHGKETPEFRHMWYLRRREKILIYAKMYKKREKDRVAEHSSRRRARKQNAPIIEEIDRQAIIERDKWTCYLCGVICTSQNVTLDHVVPLYRDGTHTADNLHVACRPCNCRKGTKLLCEFLLSA